MLVKELVKLLMNSKNDIQDFYLYFRVMEAGPPPDFEFNPDGIDFEIDLKNEIVVIGL